MALPLLPLLRPADGAPAVSGLRLGSSGIVAEVEDWTSNEVLAWLRGLALVVCSNPTGVEPLTAEQLGAIAAACIKGPQLLALTATELSSLKVAYSSSSCETQH